MQFTKNFNLAELTKTSTGLPNIPLESDIGVLNWLAIYLLQPIRDKFGPMKINSGFRSPMVNADPSVRGHENSQHLFGEAADFWSLLASLDDVYLWVAEDSHLIYGQLIKENRDGKRWLHISLPRVGKPICENLVFDGVKYSPWKG